MQVILQLLYVTSLEFFDIRCFYDRVGFSSSFSVLFFSGNETFYSAYQSVLARGWEHMSNVKGPDEAQNPSFEDLVAQYQGSVLRMCFLYLCDKTSESLGAWKCV